MVHRETWPEVLHELILKINLGNKGFSSFFGLVLTWYLINNMSAKPARYFGIAWAFPMSQKLTIIYFTYRQYNCEAYIAFSK